MRFFSLAVFVCSLWTASAVRDYNFEIHIVNENAANTVCTNAELDDLSKQVIPTILSVLADPKYDLKPTQASDWKNYGSQPVPNKRKERELCTALCTSYCATNPHLCDAWCPLGCRRMLRSQRELTEAEVLEIKSNTEGSMRGLLNQFVNTSPYSKDCTKALTGATIGSTMEIR